MDDEAWVIVLTALTTVLYAVLVSSKGYQERRLRRFRNSAAAGHLYTFSYGMLAVVLPLAFVGGFELYASLLLFVLASVPLVMAEVVRSRADRRAQQQIPPSSATPEVTK